jgi:hypothetical protein
MVRPVHGSSDAAAIAAFYRRYHPHIQGRLTPPAGCESQIFIEQESGGSVIGVALVVRLDTGVATHGIIAEFEVAPEHSRWVGNALAAACRDWFAQRAISLICGTGIRIDDQEAGWYLDTQDGTLKEEAPRTACQAAQLPAAPIPYGGNRYHERR